MPFGELLVDNSTVDLDFRFSAKETDRESGLGYFGARYYDNTSAMWLGVDPLWEKYAGMNPYNYCAGNPVMLMDRDGREPRVNLVKNRRDSKAVRTPGKGYNCGSGFYSVSDGGCTFAAVKQLYEKWSIDYYSDLDDNRVKSGAGGDISKTFSYYSIPKERFFMNSEVLESKNIQINELTSLLEDPNIDFIGTFDTHDPDAAVNTAPYHTMVIDSIDKIIYYEKGRNAGKVRDIILNCYDSDNSKHDQIENKLTKVNLSNAKKIVKFTVNESKLKERDKYRNTLNTEP